MFDGAFDSTHCVSPEALTVSHHRKHQPAVVNITINVKGSNRKEEVVNIPTQQQARITDWCGMVSGRNVDKFAESGLTQGASSKVQCPIIDHFGFSIRKKNTKRRSLSSRR
jgi:flavin reductase (DIM6/NTAB) family NADH-FMN oxidoreductase RutF